MKKLKIEFILTLLVASVLSSCGGGGDASSDSSEDSEPQKVTLEVSNNISGPLADYFIIEDAAIRTEEFGGSRVMVKVQRTEAELPFNPADVDVCEYGSSKTWKFCFSPDVLDDIDIPLSSSLSIYDTEPLVDALMLNAGETKWLEFSCYDIDGKNINEAKSLTMASSFEPNKTYSYGDGGNVDIDMENMDDLGELMSLYEETAELYGESLVGDMDASDALELADDVLDLYDAAGGDDAEVLREAVDVLDDVNDLLDW